ncbi:ATP-binding protein [Pseudomonas saponiphila]|uniref:histidine kinase n=1 Tax=Pseudomonas saponiphila TaxID=556534 RepID=A0A1H4MG11_9PSED|nr:ATP-binding protein [Pseudomonas saponiphila]SEB81863.1 Response regulator receiver domain-containing protein [Pseudomonas saponiphila]
MPFLSDHHGCQGWKGEMAERIRAFDWSVTSLGALRNWSHSLRSTVQLMLGSPVPMVMLWGPLGYMIYNDAYAVFAGGRHPYLLGCAVELGWPEVAEFNRGVMHTCLSGGTLSYRNKELVLLRNGEPESVWLDLYYSPVAGDDQAPAGVIAIVVETTGHVISEQRRQAAEDNLRQMARSLEQRVLEEVNARMAAEEQLRQSQKLEAIGGLTGGVAHDFNNLLQVIAGNLHLLARHEPDNGNVQRRTRAALTAVERGAKLSAQLLAFARRQPLSPALYDPRELDQGLAELLRRALGETIRLQVQLPAEPWCIHVDRNQLENAVLNLAINARDAMAGEGTIGISVENLLLDRRFCAGTDLSPGQYLRLTVADSGGGMSAEVLKQAFEPFFTTKTDGHGTGLGLSMVFGFVKQSGGHIEILSRPGQGTRVQMYFARSAARPALSAAGPVPRASAGQERILVVEDDTDVRGAAVEMLKHEGYQVCSAASGDAAMQLLAQGLVVDLIFTDVVMPGQIKSTDLATWARTQAPPVAVLFTSGHTRDMISRNHQLSPDTHLLSKPYAPEDLSAMVRSLLGG